MQSVELEWHGPFGIDEFQDIAISEEIMGIYAFVDSDYDEQDHHWIYHRGALLYIGKVYEQSFIDRLNQHLREEDSNDPWLWIERYHEYEVTIKTARVILAEGERISAPLVSDVESLLIAVLQPKANVSSTRTYGGRDLNIRSIGRNKPLPPHISTGDLEY